MIRISYRHGAPVFRLSGLLCIAVILTGCSTPAASIQQTTFHDRLASGGVRQEVDASDLEFRRVSHVESVGGNDQQGEQTAANPSQVGEADRDSVSSGYASYCPPFCDEKPFLPMLLHDARSVATGRNLLILSAAGGAAVAVHQDWDEAVRRYTARHEDRWGDFGSTLGELGHPAVQIPALVAFSAYSRWTEDEELHDLSEALASAYIINLTATTGLKLAANTRRPDEDVFNGKYGFPSFHTSSSFTLAAVLEERYGWEVGLPAYALAGAIGWTRIDQRNHDLSDVLFGAALGYVIGKSVARNHFMQQEGVRLVPYIDPVDGTAGVVIEKFF